MRKEDHDSNEARVTTSKTEEGKERNSSKKQLVNVESNKFKFYCCGSSQHTANNPNCFARNAICRKCGRSGHFTRVF